jgi:adenine-specific DNA-methyltransferase
MQKRFLSEVRQGITPETWWGRDKAGDNKIARYEMKDLIPSNLFDTPKPTKLLSMVATTAGVREDDVMLDFFAGSGTTAHAVINLNREDGGHRKYVLVEMGEYFNTVLKPRIQKVVYSKDWRDGKPVSREGSSHLFKYLRLESYEDTLNNLAFRTPTGAQLALSQGEAFREDYTLHYMLDAESRYSLLNVHVFEDPFAYTLEIATGVVGETRPVAVDLVETFNYLLGLRVRHVDVLQGYRVVQGLNPGGERVLVLWRNLKEKSNADLEAFFRKQDYNPRDMEFDLIYVNGDNGLENLRRPDETWKVRLIEEEFMRLMFDVGDV